MAIDCFVYIAFFLIGILQCCYVPDMRVSLCTFSTILKLWLIFFIQFSWMTRTSLSRGLKSVYGGCALLKNYDFD